MVKIHTCSFTEKSLLKIQVNRYPPPPNNFAGYLFFQYCKCILGNADMVNSIVAFPRHSLCILTICDFGCFSF